MDETDNAKIVTLYGLTPSRSVRATFNLVAIKARLSYVDTSYGLSRNVYETLEDDLKFFGRQGRQWVADNEIVSLDPKVLIKRAKKSRGQEINRAMNAVEEQYKWMNSLKQLERDLDNAATT